MAQPGGLALSLGAASCGNNMDLWEPVTVTALRGCPVPVLLCGAEALVFSLPGGLGVASTSGGLS